MMERLERNKNLEAEEKLKLEEEIRAKHDEVQRIQDEVMVIFTILSNKNIDETNIFFISGS